MQRLVKPKEGIRRQHAKKYEHERRKREPRHKIVPSHFAGH
jgi:hypothetical protein